MKLNKPFLAKCSNRSSMPRSNDKYGGPDDWFNLVLLEQNNLFGISFDFFVDWSKNVADNEIWIKYILDNKVSYDEFIADCNQILITDIGFREIAGFYNFCRKQNLNPFYLVFNDDQDWTSETSSVLKVQVTSINEDNKNIESSVSEVKIQELREVIKQKSGGPVKIGSKGLIYGTSLLECYLSKSDSLYPGDMDMLIYNSDFEVIAIIEYKKHNLNTPISEQKLGNYYPYPDGRKYNRLQIIRNMLKVKTPILVLYYPTKTHFKEGRLELIDGELNKLKTLVASPFSLERLKQEPSLLINKVIKASNYYNRID